MTKLFVKKLVSLNPDQHEKIPLEDALESYHFYAKSFAIALRNGFVFHKEMGDGDALKTFDEWLKTEI